MTIEEQQQRDEQYAALTFRKFQIANRARCVEAFPQCEDWSLNDWAVALAGEVGELCNRLKKAKRGDAMFAFDGPGGADARGEVLRELADVITYADAMVSILGSDTAGVVSCKFDHVSERIGYEPRLLPA